jgi:splicing factor 45
MGVLDAVFVVCASHTHAPLPCVMDLYSLAGLDKDGSVKKVTAPPPAPSATASDGAESISPQPTGGASWSSGIPTRMLPPKVAKKPVAAKPKPVATIMTTAVPPMAGPSALLGTNVWFKDIKAPYDPAHPNNYDEWARKKATAQKAKELQATLQAKEAEASRKLSSLTATAGAASASPVASPSFPAASPPPPPPLAARLPQAQGEFILPARSQDAKRQRVEPAPPTQPAASGVALGLSAASSSTAADGEADADPGMSMLVKMGWSEGQGLGKDGQGMKTPLVARKTNAGSGVIVNAAPQAAALPPLPPPPAAPPPATSTATASGGGVKGAVTFRGRPSRVLLLKNMVGPGEVDAGLQGEIGEECSKYGEVLKVTVYEVPSAEAAAPEEAVRIFVQFAKQAAAMKAYIDLDGRFFGGRSVWVAFFAEADFEQGSLAPNEREPKR